MRSRKESKVGKAVEQGKTALWGVFKFVGTVAASAIVSVLVVEKFQQYRGLRQNPEPEPLPEPASPHPAMVFTGQASAAAPASHVPIVQYIFAPKAVENPELPEEPEVVEEEVDADEAYLEGWLEE